MEFRLPDLGEGMAEAEIVRWLVDEGATVGEDDPLVEVETDKALVQIPSPAAGRLVRRGAADGDRLAVGEVLAVIEAEGASSGTATTATPAAGPSADAAALADAAAPAAHDAGAIVGSLDPREEMSVEETPARAAAAGGRVAASPATRRLGRELGVDLAQVRGTGPGGRVTAADVRAHAAAPAAPAAAAPAAVAAPAAAVGTAVPHNAVPAGDRQTVGLPLSIGAPLPASFGRQQPLRGLRRRIAEHMAAAHRTVPQVTHVEEIDVTALVALRKQMNAALAANAAAETAGGAGPARLAKVSYLPYIAAAAVEALRRHPILNSSLDEDKGQVVIHPHIHLGIAADTEQGLLVPVVREAERYTVPAFAREIPALAAGARNRSLPAERLRGSTFTITSAGSVGGLFATPIVNHPEVAILGIHRIVPRPTVVEGDRIEVRQQMYVSVSFDHRVLDGAEAARFTNDLAAILANPAALLWG